MLFNAEMLFALYQHLLQQILWISMHKKQIVPTELSQGFKQMLLIRCKKKHKPLFLLNSDLFPLLCHTHTWKTSQQGK